MRKALESKLAKIVNASLDTPTYEELATFWDDAEGQIVILKKQLADVTARLAEVESQRDKAWDVVNRVEDILEEALADDQDWRKTLYNYLQYREQFAEVLNQIQSV